MDIIDKIWMFGMPIVQCYHVLTGSVFLNTSDENATGLERAANIAFSPFQYVFAGRSFTTEDGINYDVKQHFDYRENMAWKTTASLAVLPFSLAVGTCLKALAYLSPEVQKKQGHFAGYLSRKQYSSQNAHYRSLGLEVSDFTQAEVLPSQGYARRPEEERLMSIEKEALQEIARILQAADIPFWVDCGTCLGAYRYGGVIPWDMDIDIAILQPDSENVRHLLSALDPSKYVVQDWSSRDKPHSYLKVYIRETGMLLDIYHFKIDAENKTLSSIVANEESIFLPESWKIRERRFKIPTPFSVVFPLKKGNFDGIAVPMPHKTENYLKMRYGENIGPTKVFDPLTGRYEKDLSHPYWQLPYVH